MKLFDPSEENELDTYMSREVPVLEGDEPQSLTQNIRGNLGSKMGLIRKRAKISFCELEFKNQ